MMQLFKPMQLNNSDYARHMLPIAPIDVIRGRLIDYKAVNPRLGHFPPACQFERCRQSYFEMRFFLGEYRMIGFHGGLN